MPLIIIAGLYLARFNQLSNLNSIKTTRIPEIQKYFKPAMYIISSTGLIIILSGYFITASLSSYYNKHAKALMLQHKYQDSNSYFVKAQKLAPLMDNPFFSHADLSIYQVYRDSDYFGPSGCNLLFLEVHTGYRLHYMVVN